MSNHEKRTLTFKVQSFRRIPNPYLKSEEGEKGAEMYIAICDVKDIPDNFPTTVCPKMMGNLPPLVPVLNVPLQPVDPVLEFRMVCLKD